ncbi:MAG: hypothetical protein N2114_07175 [Candidatus Goldbacteria bacterium]|nr:hypothetical protein [Candidatus Goldiibacteriota bacterium]
MKLLQCVMKGLNIRLKSFSNTWNKRMCDIVVHAIFMKAEFFGINIPLNLILIYD